MNRVRPLVLMITFAGAVAAWAARPTSLLRAALAAPVSEGAARADGTRLQGVASCASTACHNANGPRGSKGSEYPTWAASDPHARAYRVLFEERSVRMAKYLKLPGGRPENANLCL